MLPLENLLVDEKQQEVIKFKYFIFLPNIPVHEIQRITKVKRLHVVKMMHERKSMVRNIHSICKSSYHSLIGIINQLNDADDLEETFRQIAKDHSDCSSGQRGGRDIDRFNSKID